MAPRARRLAAPLLVLLGASVAGAALAAPATARWRAPVAGAVARPFAYAGSPFRAGLHRGVDLTAPPGAVVRATCGGTVVAAGASPGGRVVTLRCGAYRVTHLPLARVRVRRGARVRPGVKLGTLAASGRHAGLHLGVRRDGDPFGYVDPLPILGADADPAAPVVAPRVTATRGGSRRDGSFGEAPAPATPAAATPGLATPAPATPAPATPAPATPAPATRGLAPARTHASHRQMPLAPWPAWAGLALALTAGAGAGTLRLRARTRAAGPAPAPASAGAGVR